MSNYDLPHSLSFQLKPVPLHHVESTRLLESDVDEATAMKSSKSAYFRGVVNLGASILGTGLLSMPGACKDTGVLFFVVATAIAAFTCHTTAVFLIRTVKFLAPKHGFENATYAGLASHVYGSTGERTIQIYLVFQQLGACVGYIIVIGDIFHPLLRFWTGYTFSEAVIRNSFVWLLMFPLTVVTRDLASLEYASMAAVLAITLFCVTVGVNWLVVELDPTQKLRLQLLQGDEDDTSNLSGPFWFPPPDGSAIDFVKAVPLISFAFDMAFNAVPVYEDMKVDIYYPLSPVVEYSKASFTAFALSWLVTAMIGVTGYLTFLSDTKPDLLSNFAVKDTYISYPMNLVRSLYGFGLALAFPLLVFELRQVLFVLSFGSGSNLSRRWYWLFTSLIFIFTSVLVMYVDNITSVFIPVGVIVTPSLDYIFPSLLYLNSGCCQKYDDALRPKIVLAAFFSCYALMIIFVCYFSFFA